MRQFKKFLTALPLISHVCILVKKFNSFILLACITIFWPHSFYCKQDFEADGNMPELFQDLSGLIFLSILK